MKPGDKFKYIADPNGIIVTLIEYLGNDKWRIKDDYLRNYLETGEALFSLYKKVN